MALAILISRQQRFDLAAVIAGSMLHANRNSCGTSTEEASRKDAESYYDRSAA